MKDLVGGESVKLDSNQRATVAAFNIMGGKFDFSQLNDIAEYLQVDDCELFIDGLLVLKKHSDDNHNSN